METIPTSWWLRTKARQPFSDIANEIALSRNFWSCYAFASGGSAGYDHKKMGITAKGAWEAVKRHFREMDIDIQTAPFTVAGIGDMSGDVFGNGMLLSKAIKLVAAFDHRDIFIDPNSGPRREFCRAPAAFRSAAFELPELLWSKISKGGGVTAGTRNISRSQPKRRNSLAWDPQSLRPKLRRRSSKRPWTSYGSAASALMCGLAARQTRAGERQGERRDPGACEGRGGEGDRRGRQSRRDPARAHRIRA